MKHLSAPRVVSASLVLVLLLAEVPARADDASEAALQNALAAELYRRRHYGEALEHLLASNRLVQNPNVVLNVAQTYAVLERYVDAYNWYETYLRIEGPDEAARVEARRAQARIERHVGVVVVRTDPAGAELFVDRIELGSVGRSPARVAVAPGTHRIVARRAGHRDATSEPIGVEGGAEVEASLSLAPILGTLVVRSSVEGSQVVREQDGVALGTTPLSLELPVGSFRVVVSAEGFVAQTRPAEIVDGSTTSIDVELAPDVSRVAVLTVDGSPRSARVRLDGVDLGIAPLTLPGLTPGEGDLAIEADGYTSFRGRVLLEPGAATRVSYALVDPSRGPSPRLRWLGYGVGGALAATGVGVGLRARASRDAFFDDPSHDAYERVARLNHVADGLMISGLVVAVATLVVDLVVHRPQTRADVEVER